MKQYIIGTVGTQIQLEAFEWRIDDNVLLFRKEDETFKAVFRTWDYFYETK